MTVLLPGEVPASCRDQHGAVGNLLVVADVVARDNGVRAGQRAARWDDQRPCVGRGGVLSKPADRFLLPVRFLETGTPSRMALPPVAGRAGESVEAGPSPDLTAAGLRAGLRAHAVVTCTTYIGHDIGEFELGAGLRAGRSNAEEVALPGTSTKRRGRWPGTCSASVNASVLSVALSGVAAKSATSIIPNACRTRTQAQVTTMMHVAANRRAGRLQNVGGEAGDRVWEGRPPPWPASARRRASRRGRARRSSAARSSPARVRRRTCRPSGPGRRRGRRRRRLRQGRARGEAWRAGWRP